MKVKTTILEILSYVFKWMAITGVPILFEMLSSWRLSAFVGGLIVIAPCLGIGIALGVWETKLEKKRDAIKKVKRIDYIILWVIVGLFLLEMIAMPKFITAGNVIGLFYLTIAGYIRKLNAKIRDGKNCPVVKEQENRDVESGSKIEGGNGE